MWMSANAQVSIQLFSLAETEDVDLAWIRQCLEIDQLVIDNDMESFRNIDITISELVYSPRVSKLKSQATR